MVDIYTLPSCPVCEMIKRKLDAKAIPYEEHPFEECLKFVKTDRAPIMVVSDNLDLSVDPITADVKIMGSPKQMSEWIKDWEG